MTTYGKLKLAREANELDDNHKVLAADRALVDAHHKKHFGSDYTTPANNDMIHIGDQVQHLPQPPKSGWLGKMLLGLGLLGTGAGMGVGGTLVASAIKSALEPAPQQVAPEAPPAQAPAQTHDDHDTQFELRLAKPAKKE